MVVAAALVKEEEQEAVLLAQVLVDFNTNVSGVDEQTCISMRTSRTFLIFTTLMKNILGKLKELNPAYMKTMAKLQKMS